MNDGTSGGASECVRACARTRAAVHCHIIIIIIVCAYALVCAYLRPRLTLKRGQRNRFSSPSLILAETDVRRRGKRETAPMKKSLLLLYCATYFADDFRSLRLDDDDNNENRYIIPMYRYSNRFKRIDTAGDLREKRVRSITIDDDDDELRLIHDFVVVVSSRLATATSRLCSVRRDFASPNILRYSADGEWPRRVF